MLLPPLAPGARRPPKPLSRWGVQRQPRQKLQPVWQQPPGRRFNSFIVAPDALLTAGHTGLDAADTTFLAAVNLEDGSELWREPLPAPVIQAGTAVNHQGQIFVSLETGQILAFAAED